MVDTITIRIHNIKTYKLLYEQFKVVSEKLKTVSQGQIVVDEDGVVSEKYKLWQRVRAFGDTGKFLPDTHRVEMHAPSSNYTFNAVLKRLDTDKAFLEIEFSIPKYFYGTNVFQFLGIPSASSESNFFNLIKGIRRVFKDKFSQIPKDSDVEIFRLDMCYNQFLKCKKEAMDYLSMQREWMKKYCEGKNMRLVDSYATTWTIVTSRYSFKCYHKGTEFHEKDYKQLAANMNKHNYNLNKLQNIADCILRYEITFRRSMFQYLTMYYTFQDVEKKKGYMLNSRLYSYLNKVKKMGSFAMRSHVIGINVKETSPIDYFINKKKHFCLRSDFDDNYTPLCVYSDAVTFNYQVYRLLYDWFWNFIRKAQPDDAIPIYKIQEKIALYQEKKARWNRTGVLSKDKLKKGNLREAAKKNTARILIPALLSQYLDMRELKKYLPERTYYRLMGDFKEIGIPTKNDRVPVNKPPLDYVHNTSLLEPMKKNKFI